MRKLIISLTIILAFVSTVSFAGEFAVENPGLSLYGNEVTMRMSIKDAGLTSQVKVYFHGNTTGFTETSVLQPYYDWYVSSEDNKTSLAELYQQGWVVRQIIPYNATAAKQFYIVVTK